MPDKLDKQINFMRKNNYKFTYCNYKKINNDKEIPVFSKKKRFPLMIC